jgi:hypothetical protein
VRVGLSIEAILAVTLTTMALVGCGSSLVPTTGTGGRAGGGPGGAGGGLIDGGGGLLGATGGVGGMGASCESGNQCPMGACFVAGSCVCGLPLVCFGSDPTPYAQYLNPRDGGYSAGYCPTSAEFRRGCGEGSVCYFGCGPLSPGEIDAAYDAGVRAATDGGLESCCFWVVGIPGV